MKRRVEAFLRRILGKPQCKIPPVNPSIRYWAYDSPGMQHALDALKEFIEFIIQFGHFRRGISRWIFGITRRAFFIDMLSSDGLVLYPVSLIIQRLPEQEPDDTDRPGSRF